MNARPGRAIAGVARRWAGVVLLLGTGTGCWLYAIHGIPDTTSRYDILPAESMRRFEAARREQDAGHLETARAELEEIAREHPDVVPVGIWLQEAEIALLESPPPSPSKEASPPPPKEAVASSAKETPGDSALQALRERYRARAEERPSLANLVLAARVEPDPLAAAVLLAAAEKKDDKCAWPPYALAYLAARAGDWPEVRSRLERARKADPGHMLTRWLEMWMLARNGSIPEAATSLDTWLKKARGNWFLDQRLVRAADVDRALLALLDDRTHDSQKYLAEVDSQGLEPGRVQMVMAAIREASEDPHGALAAAEAAEMLRPGDLLPVVQQALLQEFWLSNPDAAEAAWARVLAISRASPELGALLERLRARIRLERLQAAREAAAKKAAPGAPGDTHTSAAPAKPGS